MKSYIITPIFIFDGKPPIEKHELLIKRKILKETAEHDYWKLHDKLNTPLTELERTTIMKEMDNLKHAFIRIKPEDNLKIKALMDAYGVIYYDAPGEADEMCAHFVNSGKAWGCVSDDMDMFLHGCPYIIRNLSLNNKTVFIYDRNEILTELGMTNKQFCEALVLSGTDYNISSKTSINRTMELFGEYQNYKKQCTTTQPYEFYVWLIKNTKYIENYLVLLRTYQMFQTSNDKYDNLEEKHEMPLNRQSLQSILEKEKFVFLNQCC